MHSAQHDYLATEVLTATPQKLQLILLDAALRFGNLARAHLRGNDSEAAIEALTRCQQIVAELIAGLDAGEHPELVQRITAVYVFVYRALVAAGYRRDEQELNAALRVLEIERQTWRMLCERTSCTSSAKGTVPAPHVAPLHSAPAQTGQSFVA